MAEEDKMVELEQAEAMPEATETTPGLSVEHRFTKEQLLNSMRYSGRKDALSVVLKEDKTYTHKEVELELNKFLKRKVK